MKLKNGSRVIIIILSLGLIITYFVPFWGIYLFAPQYPEGLKMNIWLHKLTGEVDTINGLNHYIGMKHINPDMFPEFSFLNYVVGFFIAFGLIVALTGNRKLLLGFLIVCLAGGIAAMVDFYKWGYNYGHHLDPKAPIQIPGFSYQPPLVGHRRLLNFDAYSYPALGAWIFIAVWIITGVIWFFETFKIRKGTKVTRKYAIPIVLVITILNGCKAEPEPINYGKDDCAYCKMTIIDSRYGGELLMKKGRVFKFDDISCLVNYLKSNPTAPDQIKLTLLSSYLKQGEFITISNATLLKGDKVKSPMNGNIAAVETSEAASLEKAINGHTLTWQQFYDSN